MAAFSGSSASKLLAVAIWASVIIVVAMEVPSSMAARTVPADNLSGENDAANPEWPCCRQYQDPPSVPAEKTAEATAVVGPVVTLTTALADHPIDHEAGNSGNITANPEWPLL